MAKGSPGVMAHPDDPIPTEDVYFSNDLGEYPLVDRTLTSYQKYYDVMDPFVVMGAAAAVTSRLKLGTGICLVPQRDPIQTAKSVASLDQISHGRFLFGVGAGWNAEEMAHHGTEFKQRSRIMADRIAAMRTIWTEETAEYHGEFVDFGPMTCSMDE